MTTVAILPIKRFDQAKQRLGGAGAAGAAAPLGGAGAAGEASPLCEAPRLADQERASLAASMSSRVLAALAAAERLDAVLVVTAEASAAGAARGHGFEVVDEPVLAGHNAAAQLGIARAMALAASRALLVPGDCPLLSGGEIDGLVGRHEDDRVVIVPDRHGTGTNALLLRPPDAIAPAFGPGSRERHERLAREAGFDPVVDEVRGLLLDVDTPDDLAVVERLTA